MTCVKRLTILPHLTVLNLYADNEEFQTATVTKQQLRGAVGSRDSCTGTGTIQLKKKG
jgi:hypothetical protein